MNFTSSLPDELLQSLDTYARKFGVPKNHILEQALRAYFRKLKKAEYIHSFKRAGKDPAMQHLVEEGLVDYLKILDEE